MPPTVVFDSYCVLCSRWVHLILRHERGRDIIFVSAWSERGSALAAEHGLSPRDLDATYLFIDGGRGLVRSDAGLALLARMRAPWRFLLWLRVVPRPLRDRVYDLVARNRYRWFGKADRCFVPPPGMAHRFIDRD
ncbi:DCC1-like thiol-disulfide oxidoreductase family protein [Parerythrobacter aurantius]|uniref:thiol-disulfide oxidoreductase DCC family protein n=1 Tax=Parerythrobacter aurantius TaxID=3127706 RepID=UPI003253897A